MTHFAPGAFVIEAALLQRTSSRPRPWRFHQVAEPAGG